MKPLLIAHRGASLEFPENTLEAFERAFKKYRADMIEFDVQYSRDKVPVVIHDPTLERTTLGKGAVRRRTLAELKQLKVRGKAGRSRVFRIPTLEEVIKKFPHGRFIIEIKEPSALLTRRVAGLVRQYHIEKTAVVTSKYHVVYETMRKEYPSLRRALSHLALFRMYVKFKRGRKAVLGSDPKTSGVRPHLFASMPLQVSAIRLDRAEWIEYLHRHGICVMFWTINEPGLMQELRDKRADGLITDHPGLMRKVFEI